MGAMGGGLRAAVWVNFEGGTVGRKSVNRLDFRRSVKTDRDLNRNLQKKHKKCKLC